MRHWVTLLFAQALLLRRMHLSEWQITCANYCKTLNVSVPFISRILRAKKTRKIKGREYQLQAKIGQNYYSISNCMVLIRENIRGQNNFAC